MRSIFYTLLVMNRLGCTTVISKRKTGRKYININGLWEIVSLPFAFLVSVIKDIFFS